MFLGEKYRGFILQKALFLEELGCTLRQLVHETSGAEVMQLENDDPENLFCLSFKTLPSTSNGVAHILEHAVLCGSRKFPIKDPFFSMTRRSLNTFMNAMTGADFTCYPAASQVEKDFYNLLEVYLDAVFHPQLKKLSFLQEGHRLEYSDPSDPKSGLLWKGVVFNEMKGALSAPDARLWHTLMEHLVPDLTYACISGGDPQVIPQLTYEELISFHETYYHPSRCLFFFYGNLPLKKHLDFIFENSLKNVAAQPPLPAIPKQRRFTRPVYKEGFFPLTETENLQDKCLIGFAFLTAPLLEQDTILALTILDAILMDSDASPLKHRLLQSQLCVSADAYIDTEMTEVPYVIVCKGCKEENGEMLENTLKKALQEIIEEEIPPHLIEAAIHQLEFARTEIAGDHAPYGLTLFMRSALAKQHGCPPENALLIHSLFDKLIKATQDPHYLLNLLKKYFLDNPHFVRVVLKPDPALAHKEEAIEKERLQKIEQSLKESEIQSILAQAQELAQYQKETEGQNIDCLPKVNLEDVPLLARDFPLYPNNLKNWEFDKEAPQSFCLERATIAEGQGASEDKNFEGKLTPSKTNFSSCLGIHVKESVYHHPCFTNQIVYADLSFDLPHLEEDDLPYAQLLLSLLPELGVKDRTYIENLEYLQAHTGGVSATLALHVQAGDARAAKPSVVFRGKALYRKVEKLFPLLKEMALFPRLDEEKRIEELLMQIYTGLQNRFAKNAIRYAIQLATSGFSLGGKLGQIWHGLSYFKFIEQICKNFCPPVLKKIREVKEKLLSLQNLHLILSCSDEMKKTLHKEGYFGLLDLSPKPAQPWRNNYPILPAPSQAYPMASPVAFTCTAYKVATYLHPHAAPLYLASHILDNKILHPKIREQGGAYGAGAGYNPAVGHFTFHAFRDPHLAQTLQTFNESVEALASGKFDARDLEEAKLGMIQQFDVPIAPGSRAATAYAWMREGKTKEMRQKFRDRILNTSSHEVQTAVQKELLSQLHSGITVTFAGQDLLEREIPLLHSPLPIIPAG